MPHELAAIPSEQLPNTVLKPRPATRVIRSHPVRWVPVARYMYPFGRFPAPNTVYRPDLADQTLDDRVRLALPVKQKTQVG
jgi:hypothetical protein